MAPPKKESVYTPEQMGAAVADVIHKKPLMIRPETRDMLLAAVKHCNGVEVPADSRRVVIQGKGADAHFYTHPSINSALKPMANFPNSRAPSQQKEAEEINMLLTAMFKQGLFEELGLKSDQSQSIEEITPSLPPSWQDVVETAGKLPGRGLGIGGSGDKPKARS